MRTLLLIMILFEKTKIKFFEITNIKEKIKIRIKKNIPIGSGLGGGSSNAARVLLSLNQIFNYPLQEETLFEIGKELGSDVNLFLREEKLLIIENKGEKVFPIYAKDKEFFFYNSLSNIKISTKEVYGAIEKIEKKKFLLIR